MFHFYFCYYSKNDYDEIKTSNKKCLIILIVSIVIVLIAVGVILYFVLRTSESTSSNGITYTTTVSGTSLSLNTVNLIKEDTEITSGAYESTSADQNVFLVVDDATLTLGPDVQITKTGANSGNRRLVEEPSEPPSDGGEAPDKPGEGGGQGGNSADSYSFYGLNSAIVVIGEGSKAVINGVTITTDAYGANAVMAVNAGQIEIKNSTIRTSKGASRGLHATYTGKITASDSDIATQGQSCANLATDRGEGTVIAKNMKLSTAGAGSPLIYSTGDIQVTNATGKASGAQITVVEGKNSVILKDCVLSATGSGNRGNVDLAGVMIYQSMSGDASVGVGNFEAYNSDLQIIDSNVSSSVPFFFVTNAEATVILSDTTTTLKSGVFLNATGTEEWGTVGSNGGNVTMTVKGQKFSGKVSTDNISNVVINYDSSMTEKDFTYEGNVTLSQL